MPTPFRVSGILAPSGKKLAAGLYSPGAADNAAGWALALTELANGDGTSEYFGTGSLTDLADQLAAPYEMRVRELPGGTNMANAAAVLAAFNAATIPWATRGEYGGPGGYLKSGAWLLAPQLDEAISESGPPVEETAEPATVRVTVDGTADGQPVADAEVWVTSTTSPGAIVQGPQDSDSDGDVTFMLRDGNTYYLWAAKDGWAGIQGQQFTAVVD